ncbi:hypothetical protein ACFY1L_12780 [Streptomyces sp. NPDC001663]|uniref:hypothetical protein n=1 Tax=Streptomyces sp. NPDC001663 TaxID=3364597 RepID=UPI00367CA32E
MREPIRGEDVVALRAENDQLRRVPAGRAVIDQARGMLMVLTLWRRGLSCRARAPA